MSANNEFKLSQIGQVALPVTNLERAVAFYSQKLGLPHLFTVPNLAFFDCEGIRLMLSTPEEGQDSQSGSIIYFKVADIEIAHQALLARGVQFVDNPHLIARMETHDL